MSTTYSTKYLSDPRFCFKPSVFYFQFLLITRKVEIKGASTEHIDTVSLIFVFRIQDVCVLLSLIVLFLVFFNTFVFQAGFIYLLVRKFRTTICCILLYLMLSVALHLWTMVSSENNAFTRFSSKKKKNSWNSNKATSIIIPLEFI